MSHSYAYSENMAHNGKGYNSIRAARPQVLVNLTTADNDGSGYSPLSPASRNIDPADSSQQHGKHKRLDDMLQNALESITDKFGKESRVQKSNSFERDTRDKLKKTSPSVIPLA